MLIRILKSIYGKFGFKSDEAFTVMYNEQIQTSGNGGGDLFKFETCPDFSTLAGFDRRFFGADRSRLLRSILQEKSSLCCASFVGKEMVGYILAKNYRSVTEVGPLVCCSDRFDVALGLFEGCVAWVSR